MIYILTSNLLHAVKVRWRVDLAMQQTDDNMQRITAADFLPITVACITLLAVSCSSITLSSVSCSSITLLAVGCSSYIACSIVVFLAAINWARLQPVLLYSSFWVRAREGQTNTLLESSVSYLAVHMGHIASENQNESNFLFYFEPKIHIVKKKNAKWKARIYIEAAWGVESD